jgi:hypothetical protein
MLLELRRVARELEPQGTPTAAASAGELLAVAQPGVVRLWVGTALRPAAEIPVRPRVLWLGLDRQPPRIQILTADGILVTHPLQLPR